MPRGRGLACIFAILRHRSRNFGVLHVPPAAGAARCALAVGALLRRVLCVLRVLCSRVVSCCARVGFLLPCVRSVLRVRGLRPVLLCAAARAARAARAAHAAHAALCVRPKLWNSRPSGAGRALLGLQLSRSWRARARREEECPSAHMFAAELNSRAHKLEQEQRERLTRARRKQEKEALLDVRARQEREAHEEALRQRRIAEQERLEAERLQHEEDLERNNGVWWRAALRPAVVDADSAKHKSIRRGLDKVLLPPSAGAALMAQDAPKNGPQFFELVTLNGNRTHAGVLDFTALEGTAGLPPAVARNLWPGSGRVPEGAPPLTLTYKRLPKGTFARFQPRSAVFQKDVGEDVRTVLEAGLARHSVLSVGDWVSVEHAGHAYDLRVQQLRPAPAVSVIDTEMEAEVEASLETADRLAAEEALAAAALAEAARLEREATAAAARDAAVAEALAAQRERAREAREAALPPEPAASAAEGVTTCLFRLPDGARLVRRFWMSDPARLLFDFLDARVLEPGSYRLVAPFPRRTWRPEDVRPGALVPDVAGPGAQVALIVEGLALT